MAAQATWDVSNGLPDQLGATVVAGGVNFAVHSVHASAIEVCLFEGDGKTEKACIALPGRTGPVFHGRVAGLAAGALYGLRAHGPFAPAEGHRFNPNKLLVDPYALSLDRPFALHPFMFGYRADDRRAGASFDVTDSGAVVPKAIIPAASQAPARPRLATPWGKTVIYEMHVRGFTRLHPDIPEAVRGTFAGLAHPAAIAHLKRLGVTAVELLPAAAWIDERHLPPLGLTNYWGYNPIAMMAPDPRLAPGGWAEVRAATDALAAAGIETILDVVFNHTGEGDALGPTVSLRGLDNASYYRLRTDDPALYVNDAGTGNILALDDPAALRLVMDALRVWARLGGVEGFRFDLATVLGRRAGGFDPAAPLLCAIDQDPELRGLKLIAEPWDCGPGGYQLGRFPASWGEWNDRFRDTVRRFWRGDAASIGEFATRIAGSQDVFGGRAPSRSVNLVTAHDGFTLADLVSFEAKHNLANGEQNRDGADDNASWNNGVEGATDAPAVLRARGCDQRALLALLLLARGTPMISMGSEIGQNQGGNNNAYAQDNATSWIDWARGDEALFAFAARLTDIRRDHPALRADHFLEGRPQALSPYPDVAWRKADGTDLSAEDWEDPGGETLVSVLAEMDGDALDRVVLVVHRGREAGEVILPEPRDGFAWIILADSADVARVGEASEAAAPVASRSVLALAEEPTRRRKPRATDPAMLDRLAEAAGVAPEWWGLDGERHGVTPDTQRALLAGMRLPAETSHQALESLLGLAEARDFRPLPATMVLRAGDPIEIPLRFGRTEPAPRTWLVIEREDGDVARVRAAADTAAETSFVAPDGREGRALLATAPSLPPGRYSLRREDRPDQPCRLTIAPAQCFIPPAITGGRRRLGLSAQIYAVRRQGDQGIGDFTTLGMLGEAAAQQDCVTLGINPLHALFNERRDRASPYYPSDRRFLDPIYLDLAAVPLAGEIPTAARDLSSLPAIDYPAVWALKAEALARSFARTRDPALDAFIDAGGEALRRFATYQAIVEHREGEFWRGWPEGLRTPTGEDVDPFAAAHAERVRFHQYLQWLCEIQFDAAVRKAGGLELGFCRDLAVGAAPDGAEAWASAHLLAEGVSIGAPPDPFAPQGQVWGVPPFDPLRATADGYRAYASLFAANMRHAGALRIDHVLGLARQFWVPAGADGSQGAYVAFPLADLLGELALESMRAACLVIGEDLGTVPPGLRETLARRSVIGYRVLPFEQHDARFKAPEDYTPLAWACVGTHDLPPLAGWWKGLDIQERETLGLTAPEAAVDERISRERDKAALIEALAGAGLLDAGLLDTGELTPELAAAIHAYIARTPSVLAVAQTDDLAAEQTAVNLPGTDQERANWRRRGPIPLEALFEQRFARAILQAMRRERPEDRPTGTGASPG